MLDPNLRSQVAAALARLDGPVELVTALDDGPASRRLAELVDTIVGLSPRLTRREDPSSTARRPSVGVARAGEEPRVRFAGAPLGHEFTSFVLAMLQAGGVPPKVDAAQAVAIRSLRPATYEVVVSLTCHVCPDVVQALGAVAALNPGVQVTTIDGGVFPGEVAARKVLGVPAVFRDGVLVSSGRASLDELLARLAPAASAALAPRDPYDVLVVGGGPAGVAAAVYAARKGLRVGLVAERMGGQVGDTLGIENLVTVPRAEGPQLAGTLEAQVAAHGVDLVRGRRATALVPAATPGGLHRLDLGDSGALTSRTVILAPGARWRELGVPGEAAYRTKGVAFCPHCDGPLFKGRDVAVVGGGNSGVEAAIDLAGITRRVTLLEFADTLRADAVLQARLAALPNVEVRVSARTTEVIGDGERVVGLRVADRATGSEQVIAVDGVFVQIGLVPGTEWLRGAVALTPRGEIEVDGRGTTSVPGVFAAGDATTTPYKQIAIAVGEGARAALAAFEHLAFGTVSANAA